MFYQTVAATTEAAVKKILDETPELRSIVVIYDYAGDLNQAVPVIGTTVIRDPQQPKVQELVGQFDQTHKMLTYQLQTVRTTFLNFTERLAVVGAEAERLTQENTALREELSKRTAPDVKEAPVTPGVAGNP